MSGALLHHARWWRAAMLAVLCSATTLVSAEKYTRDIIREVHQPPPYKWTKFVQVEGQPEPVPIGWVSTPEGRFAHSIKIPNPVPKDSGYKWWMSSKDYFVHLCEKEAGECISLCALTWLAGRRYSWNHLHTSFDSTRNRLRAESVLFEALDLT